jgi:membrane-bound lytic murein transglycosylase D
MDLLSFALLLQLAAPSHDLQMPPPPPGMHALSKAPAPLAMPPPPQGMRALAPDEREADEDAAGSQELTEMREAEKLAIDEAPEAGFPSLSRLGVGNPLRARLEDGIEDWSLRLDHSPLDLAPVKDLKTFDVSQVAAEYDIPVEMQPLVRQYIRFFQGPGRKWFEVWLERAARYIPVMKPILERAGLPGDTVYLAMIESGFMTDASSQANAVGPWQFISATGKSFGLREDYWVDERRDPVKSTEAAAQYLGQLHRELGDWYLAWAAYNTGGGRIRRLTRKMNTKDFWAISESRWLAQETKHYVPKLIACALVAKHPRAFGFDVDAFRYQTPLEYDEVQLVDPTDLAVVARAAKTTVKKLKELNPELRRWCTPPATEEAPYVLRVPPDTGTLLAQNLARLSPRQRLTYQVYKVRPGDTLGAIARKFHTASRAIMDVNHLASARRLKVHRELVVPIPRHGKRVAPTVLARADRRRFNTPPPTLVPQPSAAPAAKVLVSVAEPAQEPAVAPPASRKLVTKREAPTQKARARQRRPLPSHRVGVVRSDSPRPMAQGSVLIETVDGRTRLTYGVRQGDTLWSISQRFGCSVEDVRRWNDLGSGAPLRSGARLTLWPTAQIVSSRDEGRPWVAESRPVP